MTAASVEAYGPGEQASGARPGDFILTHSPHLVSRLIRVGQRLRMRGPDRAFAHWSHCAIVVDAEGGLVEAEARGVQRAPFSKYRAIEYHLVRLGGEVSEEQRAAAAAFAAGCVGEPFGFGELAAISLSLLTGLRFDFGHEAHDICSGLVARALERAGARFDRPADQMLPADLAKAYGARADGA